MEDQCPSCGDEFKSQHGMKAHHKQVHGESLAGFEHECPICGDVFKDRSSEAKYCSRECYAEAHSEKMSGENHPLWKGGKVECECEYCGDTHYKARSKSDRPYCSQECAGKARMAEMDVEENPFYEGGKRLTTVCDQCGVEFEVWECTKDRQYCSTECLAKWQSENWQGENSPRWAGGTAPYGAGWNEKKKESVRERDNRECQHCGRSQDEHVEKYGEKHTVHHIQKARAFDDPKKRNHPDNLITLCKGKCHWKWEEMSPLRPV